MLILYLPLLAGLGWSSHVIPDPYASYLLMYVEKSASSAPLFLLLAWAFAVAFFISSVVKRNPQFQYLIEFFLALILDIWVSTVAY